jgi:hypothetical protein
MAEAEDIDDQEDDDDLDGLFDDAPDDIEDVVEYFAERLGVDDDTLKELAEDAAETAGIVAALALLDLFSLGWNALEAAQVDAEAAEAKAEDAEAQVGGPDLTAKLSDIASDMAEDLGEKLDATWGDEDGSGVTGLAEINAQSEYSEAKSDADVDEGWEYSAYIAEPDACDVCQGCNGTVLPSDDPWWDDYEPDSNHPGCRCIKVPLSKDEAETRGISKEVPDVEASGWKDKWPPAGSGIAVLDGVYHEKIARFYRIGK